jgi:hypothetical protein
MMTPISETMSESDKRIVQATITDARELLEAPVSTTHRIEIALDRYRYPRAFAQLPCTRCDGFYGSP